MWVRLSAARRRAPHLSGHYLARRTAEIWALIAAAAVLQLAAGIGLGMAAGGDAIAAALGAVHAAWFAPMVGAVLVSFVGYYLVYGELFGLEGGPRLSGRQMRAVVAAGFGGYLAHGASALDLYALQGSGVREREAKVRVGALGGLEHGVLGVAGWVAAVAVLMLGRRAPPYSFTLPWAVVPPPGFLVGFAAAAPIARRLRWRQGVAGALGIFADAVVLIARIFGHPLRHGRALGGMALFWAADFFAGWLGLAAFGVHIDAAVFVVAFATGMIFSRRTGPLAGAGVLTCTLSACVWYSGAPLAATVCGIFAYRFVTFWLPLPFALASLPTLRAIGGLPLPRAPGTARPPAGEPALDDAAEG